MGQKRSRNTFFRHHTCALSSAGMDDLTLFLAMLQNEYRQFVLEK